MYPSQKGRLAYPEALLVDDDWQPAEPQLEPLVVTFPTDRRAEPVVVLEAWGSGLRHALNQLSALITTEALVAWNTATEPDHSVLSKARTRLGTPPASCLTLAGSRSRPSFTRKTQISGDEMRRTWSAFFHPSARDQKVDVMALQSAY